MADYNLETLYTGLKIQWESNAEATDIGYNLFGLGLGSLWWFKDHLELSGLQKQ